MRVQGQKTTSSEIIQTRGTEAQSSEEVSSSVFRRTLTDVSKEMYSARLLEMKNEVDRQGERLVNRVDVHEYEKYRKHIKAFLEEIVSNGYAFSKEDTYASRGKHRYIAVVKVIDEKLDKLGKEVINEHADRIEILHKIDDIRGLLLDLMT